MQTQHVCDEEKNNNNHIKSRTVSSSLSSVSLEGEGGGALKGFCSQEEELLLGGDFTAGRCIFEC